MRLSYRSVGVYRINYTCLCTIPYRYVIIICVKTGFIFFFEKQYSIFAYVQRSEYDPESVLIDNVYTTGNCRSPDEKVGNVFTGIPLTSTGKPLVFSREIRHDRLWEIFSSVRDAIFLTFPIFFFLTRKENPIKMHGKNTIARKVYFDYNMILLAFNFHRKSVRIQTERKDVFPDSAVCSSLSFKDFTLRLITCVYV